MKIYVVFFVRKNHGKEKYLKIIQFSCALTKKKTSNQTMDHSKWKFLSSFVEIKKKFWKERNKSLATVKICVSLAIMIITPRWKW